MITAARVRDVLNYDPATGVVTWRQPGPRRVVGKEAGCIHKQRHSVTAWRRIGLDGKFIFAHHVAFAWMTGTLPIGLVDHRNGNGLDNRWENLRLASHAENIRARGKRRDNPWGYIGVYRVASGRWKAGIRVNGRMHWLGTFASAEDAAHIRDRAARNLHGEFAALNFPDEVAA